LSARPEVEHHELLLCGGRDGPLDEKLIQQISFRCDALEDVIEHYQRLNRGRGRDRHGGLTRQCDRRTSTILITTAARSIWNTGLRARQPYSRVIDLTRPVEEIIALVEESVRRYGEDGYVDT